MTAERLALMPHQGRVRIPKGYDFGQGMRRRLTQTGIFVALGPGTV